MKHNGFLHDNYLSVKYSLGSVGQSVTGYSKDMHRCQCKTADQQRFRFCQKESLNALCSAGSRL